MRQKVCGPASWQLWLWCALGRARSAQCTRPPLNGPPRAQHHCSAQQRPPPALPQRGPRRPAGGLVPPGRWRLLGTPRAACAARARSPDTGQLAVSSCPGGVAATRIPKFTRSVLGPRPAGCRPRSTRRWGSRASSTCTHIPMPAIAFLWAASGCLVFVAQRWPAPAALCVRAECEETVAAAGGPPGSKPACLHRVSSSGASRYVYCVCVPG
jgi:hypothetical protein